MIFRYISLYWYLEGEIAGILVYPTTPSGRSCVMQHRLIENQKWKQRNQYLESNNFINLYISYSLLKHCNSRQRTFYSKLRRLRHGVGGWRTIFAPKQFFGGPKRAGIPPLRRIPQVYSCFGGIVKDILKSAPFDITSKNNNPNINSPRARRLSTEPSTWHMASLFVWLSDSMKTLWATLMKIFNVQFVVWYYESRFLRDVVTGSVESALNSVLQGEHS